ncbi:hypothetical protein DFH06DRAFT_1322829 [Mycena polygramma]|nr:hypothetical protein DFH06DRAFT_1127338 [Mycena polygramma]KAJ7666858.1 hypothetical protein DFH06DRAFT_1322829 [Mycena polygramma]
MCDYRRLNVNTPGFVHHPPLPSRHYPDGTPRSVIMPGLDCLGSLEPHIEFPLQQRLREEIELRDPAQPFPGDPLPEELPPPGSPPKKEVRVLGARLQAREKARIAAMRETRFRKAHGQFLAQRTAVGPAPPTSAIEVAAGGAFDVRLIEDRDYDLAEVVGSSSRFGFRLIPWFGGSSRAVVTTPDKRMTLLLGGRPRDRYWTEEVVKPATAECQQAAGSIHRTETEETSGVPPVLTGGVGSTFNQDEFLSSRAAYGSILNMLVFFQLFTSIAMLRLVAYGNRLLEHYCLVAFIALRADKDKFLSYNPSVLYPTDSSVYSAATFEFGGPHYRASPSAAQGEPGTWNVLTALGTFQPMHGGHLIVWDLGLVTNFPAGTTILIPACLRYSFVKVREGEHRYSLLQWSGSGIGRWYRNGRKSDLEFAVKATKKEHDAREKLRAQVFDRALERYPFEDEMDPEELCVRAPFFGTLPKAIDVEGVPEEEAGNASDEVE